ncbi:MAG: KH domain-containing protein [Deltaproteobacteria bacterium]|nr:KH domain-containing protein [Deltaproteobacteria bacterium]
MRELVEFMARTMVDHPDEVSVSEKEIETGLVLELKVAQTDLGRIIGKHGRTAKAIRTVLNSASTKRKQRVSLEIVE